MNRFCAEGRQFLLNDKPQLIQAGEFHYFRTPHDEWEHRLGLLKGAGFNAVACYIPWLWHQLEEGVSDFDGHSHPMRNLEGFLDLAASMGLWIIARPGPYIMAETINEGIPPWVFSQYPQVAFISQENKVQNIASYLHPDFLACASKWYQEIFQVLAPRQVTRNGKIILIQLDNEMGMMHWVRNIFDVNPDTLARFAAYLTARYGDRLAGRYPASDLPGFLREQILHPTPQYGVQIAEDYRRFFRDYLREYGVFLVSEAKKNGLEVAPVINIHGFMNGGKTFPIGISQLVEVMELEGVISATDVYPEHIDEGNFHQLLLVNEMTKAVQNPQQPLFSIEFQAGGNQDFGGHQTSFFDLHTRLCVSSGMRAINHYLFFDGENDPILSPTKRHDWGHPVRKDGTLRRHYARYPKLSRVLHAYGADLILSRPQTVATIGFQLDNFMTEVNNVFSKAYTDVITHQREMILFDLIARGLALTHRPFNALDLERDPLDASQTPLCWVMMDRQCNAATQQKLVDYVRQGGRLLLAGRMCVEDFAHQPCTILQEALGITHIQDEPTFMLSSIQAFGYQGVPVSFVEACSGDFDEVFATSAAGETVGFIKTIGRGKVLFFGAALGTYTLDDLDIVHQMAIKMGCPPLFTLSDWADVRVSQGDNGSFLFINNYQDDPLETTIAWGDEALFGGHPVSLPARRGLILPLDWRVDPNILLHYSTAEISSKSGDDSTITLKTEPAEFFAELTVTGYRCEGGVMLQESSGTQRVELHGKDGVIVLIRNKPL